MVGTRRTAQSTGATSNASIGVLYAGYQSTYEVVTGDTYSDTTALLPIYDLPAYDLKRFDGVVVPSVVDQEFLAQESQILVEYLDAGGVLVSFAKVFRDWLKGYRWRTHPTPASELDLELVREHPVFDPVSDRDLNLYEGVRGWFTRGYFETPEGAEPLVVDADNRSIVAVDEESTTGTILATAGSDLFHTAFRDHDPFPAVVAQLLKWVTSESGIDHEEQRKGVS
ncbi:MAG: hypothetical protein ABEH78_06970 [Haloferacaceae archaeon]